MKPKVELEDVDDRVDALLQVLKFAPYALELSPEAGFEQQGLSDGLVAGD